MQYNTSDPMNDSIVLPGILFKYYPPFNVSNYSVDDWNIIRKYLLFCSMLYHLGIIFNCPIMATTYYKCILIYNISYRYLYSIDPYTSVKNILTAMFLFDLFENVLYKQFYKRKRWKTIDYILLYHHIVILMVYIFEPSNDFTHTVVFGEVGNIPLNIEYCLIKHRSAVRRLYPNDETKIFKIINEINAFTYIFVRIFCYTYFLLFLDFKNYSTYYAFIPLYAMGIGWSRQLIIQLYKKHLIANNIVD